jgi:hypothetical protein
MIRTPLIANRMAPIPVGHISEELWGCQEMEQAAGWLQLLNHSIMRARLDTYDVSECFLSIQGTAFRFTAQINGIQKQAQEEFDDEILVSLWEESMWAAAVLARICVGPAWIFQLQQRRAFLANNHQHHHHAPGDDATWTTGTSSLQQDSTPVEIVATNNSSPRSFSPMTFSSAVDTDTYFPPIPEALPGIMLRFAASALDALPKHLVTRSLAEAQRELVLALCCCSGDLEGPERAEWTIPGVHAPVEAMVSFWLESTKIEPQGEHYVEDIILPNTGPTKNHPSPEWTSSEKEGEGEKGEIEPISIAPEYEQEQATTHDFREQSEQETPIMMNELRGRPLDWWYCLQVARASMDLITCGWRPRRGHDVVLRLLDMAEKGISLQGLTCNSADTGKKAREERVAATASAAEAISALSTMGSRGLIPESSQAEAVKILVDLQVLSGLSAKIVTSIFPLGISTSPEDEEESQLQLETFLSQRDACFADNADLLWVLLAEPASCTISVASLMEMLKTGGNSKNNVVMRVLSGAFWGKPPTVPSIEHLRIYWSELLNVLGEKSNSAAIDIQHGESLLKNGIEKFTSVLEIVAGIGRFVDATLFRGHGELSPIEWDSFIQALDTSIISWLSIDDRLAASRAGSEEVTMKIMHRLLNKIHQELENMLLKVGDFLDRAAAFETAPCHLVVDDEFRHDLHLMLLRKAAPLMSPKNATRIGCCVIRSWASVDFLPFRSEEWVVSASNMVQEAFCVFEDEKWGLYGGYVHSPMVRLEVLKSITDNAADQVAGYEPGADEEHTPNYRASLKKAPLRASRYLHEHYLGLVKEILIPCLNRIFGFGKGGILQPNVLPVQGAFSCTLGDRDQSSRLDRSEFALRTFAVRLIGSLFRNEAGHREHRSLFIKMLYAIGRSPKETLESDQLDDDSSTNIPEASLFPRPIVIAIGAIRQLELCLRATLSRLSSAHEHSISIVEVLRSLLEETSIAMQQSCSRNDIQTQMAFVLLSFGTLLPLARLRTTVDKRIFLVVRDDVLWHVPGSLSTFLVEENDEGGVSGDSGPVVASFVGAEDGARPDSSIAQTHGPRLATKWTLLPFSPIASSIVVALQLFAEATVSLVEDTASLRFLNDLRERLVATCYDALGNFLLSGAKLQNLGDIAAMFSTIPETKGTYRKEVQVSRCKTSTLLAQKAIISICGEAFQHSGAMDVDKLTVASINTLADTVLTTCLSEDVEISIIGCRNLRALLVPVSSFNRIFRSSTLSIILSKLCKRLEFALAETSTCLAEPLLEASTDYWMHGGDVLLALLSSLNDVVAQFKYDADGFSLDDAMNVYACCNKLVQLPNQSKASRTMAMRCASMTLNLGFLPSATASVLTSVEAVGDVIAMMTCGDPFLPCEVNEPKIMQSLALQRQRDLLFSQRSLEDSDIMELHEQAGRETENIKRFVVELDQTSEFCAAWLCDGCLLTIRLGAKHSRYCGWAEVTWRSPSNRERKLVRFSNAVSIDWPELPSTLWEETSQSSVQSLSVSEPERLSLSTNFFVESDIVSRALLLMERTDVEIRSNAEMALNRGVDNKGGPVASRSNSPRRHSSGTRSPVSTPPAYAVLRKTEDGKQLRSTFDAECMRSEETANSIHSWLCEISQALGDDKVNEIENYLENIGLCGNSARPGSLPKEKRSNSRIFPIKKLKMDSKFKRAISILDRTTTVNAHKLALLYAGRPRNDPTEAQDQASFEACLLGNQLASAAFHEFCRDLGQLVKTSHLTYFSGGFDTSGLDADGKHSLAWIDRDTMVLFHTVLFMPDGLNARKRHVGNDNVHILFVDPSSSLYQDLLSIGPEIETSSTLVSGQFGFLTIFVLPLSRMYRIIVQLKPGLDKTMRSQLIHFCGDDLVPKTQAATHVRQAAVYADLACRSAMEDLLGPPTVWEDRFCQLNFMERYAL